MNPAIEIKNLGKVYNIGHEQAAAVGTTTFRDALTGLVRKPLELITGHRLEQEKFWALEDISFDVQPGEVVGIIGRNGSGKSTLLKILSRIVEPTTGEVVMRGKVASLLEVGTGFHPELTGRENIYFNGAILGMSQREIRSKFDEIVEFSEVEKFLDTPVKFYSSGMYVRLAFAVAAHLDPDILIVDEVLAVGDAAFQKKCLGKMERVASEGRTVLFVSHSMGSVEQLCTKAAYLSRGNLIEFGNTTEVINHYIGDVSGGELSEKWEAPRDLKNNYIQPKSLLISDSSGKPVSGIRSAREDVYVKIDADIISADPDLSFGISVYSEDNVPLFWSYPTDVPEKEWPSINKGLVTMLCRIPGGILNEGSYRVEFIASLHFKEWLIEPNMDAPSIFFNVAGNLSDSPRWTVKRPGILAPTLEWQIKQTR